MENDNVIPPQDDPNHLRCLVCWNLLFDNVHACPTCLTPLVCSQCGDPTIALVWHFICPNPGCGRYLTNIELVQLSLKKELQDFLSWD